MDRCGDGSILAVFSGTRPDNLGVKDGRLAACKPTPNCVSSQADPADQEHYIEPIAYSDTMQELRRAVESMTRATVIREEGNYLYAEYKSALLGYVDDVELWLDDKTRLVHVRSASRLGRSDFGVNRKRIEELRILIGSRR
ncbi:MAG TPA: DUF1499 domain-containing protein [Steroidobacteraceae bacterium]